VVPLAVQVPLSQTPSTILVIAKEPLIQTLMCSLVDLSGHRAAQPRSDETVAAAIARVRPQLLLLDCEHDAACEDDAYLAASAIEAAVLLFTPSRSRAEVADLAAERGLQSMALPIRLHEFSETLQLSLSA
jgi:AmiR/NasT family two-component response regulator